MRIIELDARHWSNVLDFYDALLPAIGAPDWHGRSPDALLDSMIWGGINSIEPPYRIRISGTKGIPKDVLDHIELMKELVIEHRAECHARQGRDVDISLEIADEISHQ